MKTKSLLCSPQESDYLSSGTGFSRGKTRLGSTHCYFLFHRPEDRVVVVIGRLHVLEGIRRRSRGRRTRRPPEERHDLTSRAGLAGREVGRVRTLGDVIFNSPENSLIEIIVFFDVKERSILRFRFGTTRSAPQKSDDLTPCASGFW